MKMTAFASRNLKEMLRDPINFGFGLGFPIVLLLLLTAIQSNIPVSIFELDTLTPGVALFGLSFVALFSATLISKDRCSSLMLRLLASPMTASDFIFGYTLPMLPLAFAQSAVTFLVAVILGLQVSWGILFSILSLIPAQIFFIAVGLLCGTLLTDRQVGGICGALLTNLTAWLSGTWFDVKLVGGVFERIAGFFPFLHAVEAGRAAYAGDFASMWGQLLPVALWALLTLAAAVFVFRRKMEA
ncbi:MAG: ABC transporter permease [Oscillospiraceae bacterium]|nr:ABC transporter permease [Oscillospiraceae bacterium]